MKRHWYIACLAFLGASINYQAVQADVIGREDFDGGAVGLVSGFDPAANLDEGGGDFFGVANLASWPQGYPPGVPFSLTDDSVIDVAGGTRDAANAFAGDTEGVFGQAREINDNFFAISDTRDSETALGAPPTAEWTFNVQGYADLILQVDLGAQANSSFDGFSTATNVAFDYSIDGGAFMPAIAIAPSADFGDFVYRAMDDGGVAETGVNGPLTATGPQPVTKLMVEDGTVGANTFLDKTPASGAGAGYLDTFQTPLTGTGDTLTIRLSASLPFEAMAFDNVTILGQQVPEPSSFALLSLGALTILRRRRD
ncbi:MAG: PEP-CTERM sorting domain-containing protein [Planctomycetales bacterium]|nr:PEP-CTERM sorting domain-containing protein [Planctomycetales bacterium]